MSKKTGPTEEAGEMWLRSKLQGSPPCIIKSVGGVVESQIFAAVNAYANVM